MFTIPSFLASWKTSLSGAASILTGVGTLLMLISSNASLPQIINSPALAAIVGGIGLIFAKDWNVTSTPQAQK